MYEIVLELERKSWDDLVKKYTPPGSARRVALATEETVMKIAADAAADAPRDTGMLAASVAWDVWGEETEIWGKVFSPLPYARPIEFGRRPGTMPPEGELVGWMGRHGMDPENEYALRLKIAREGTKPNPFLRPAAMANQDFYLQRVLYHLFDEGA